MKRSVLMGIALILIILSGCQPKGPAVYKDDKKIKEVVDKRGAEMIIEDIGELIVPENAVKGEAEIIFRTIDYDKIIDFMPYDLVPVSAIVEVEIDPEEALEKEIELKLDYAGDEDEVITLWIDMDKERYDTYDEVKIKSKVVSFVNEKSGVYGVFMSVSGGAIEESEVIEETPAEQAGEEPLEEPEEDEISVEEVVTWDVPGEVYVFDGVTVARLNLDTLTYENSFEVEYEYSNFIDYYDFSPQGYFAYGEQRGRLLYMVSLSGMSLTKTAIGGEVNTIRPYHMRWSPSGNTLALVGSGSYNETYPDGSYVLFTTPGGNPIPAGEYIAADICWGGTNEDVFASSYPNWDGISTDFYRITQSGDQVYLTDISELGSTSSLEFINNGANGKAFARVFGNDTSYSDYVMIDTATGEITRFNEDYEAIHTYYQELGFTGEMLETLKNAWVMDITLSNGGRYFVGGSKYGPAYLFDMENPGHYKYLGYF